MEFSLTSQMMVGLLQTGMAKISQAIGGHGYMLVAVPVPCMKYINSMTYGRQITGIGGFLTIVRRTFKIFWYFYIPVDARCSIKSACRLVLQYALVRRLTIVICITFAKVR